MPSAKARSSSAPLSIFTAFNKDILMARKLSSIAPDWWDYTTLDDEVLNAAARLTADDMLKLSRPGFRVEFYDTLEDFYLAEALEYIGAWKQSTPDNPVGRQTSGRSFGCSMTVRSPCATWRGGIWRCAQHALRLPS